VRPWLSAKCGSGSVLNLERFQSLLPITNRMMSTSDASGDESVSVMWESKPMPPNKAFNNRIEKITSGLLANLSDICEGNDATAGPDTASPAQLSLTGCS
jgi:hypothetical protein